MPFDSIISFYLGDKVESNNLYLRNRPFDDKSNEISFYDNGKWNENEHFVSGNYYFDSINIESLSSNEIKKRNDSGELKNTKTKSQRIYCTLLLFYYFIKETYKNNQNQTSRTKLYDFISDKDSLVKYIEKSDKKFIEIFNDKLSKQLINGQFPLKRILRRMRESIPIGRLAEMDGYCVERMMQLPGYDLAEKAGSKQTLLGVNRMETYDVAENRFIKLFFKQIEKEYRISEEELQQKLRIKRFYKNIKHKNLLSDEFKGISKTTVIKPNFVLLQNPTYNKFYKEYIEYKKKIKLLKYQWKYRTHFIREISLLCIIEMLINKPDSFYIDIKHYDFQYLMDNNSRLVNIGKKISIGKKYSDNKIVHFDLIRPESQKQGDINVIRREIRFEPKNEKKHEFLFWYFWDNPEADLIKSIRNMDAEHNGKNKTSVITFLNPLNEDLNCECENVKILSLAMNANKSLDKYINSLFDILLGDIKNC